MVINQWVLENNDGGCFVDKGEGSTNSKKNLPVISEGSIPLAAPKEKDMDATSSSGEKSEPNDVDVRIPREPLGRT